MKSWKYTFCSEFNWGHILEFLWWWRHYCDVTCTQSVQYFAQQFSFATYQVLKSIASYAKSIQHQQANVFKRQTLRLQLSTYRPNSFKHSSHHTPVWPHEGIDRCDRCIGRRNNAATRFFLINNTFSTMNKLFTPNMYCWSCKILVTNCTNLRLFLVGWFQRCHI